ncbi:MAG: chromosomal replication initiator protein DnaA [Pseudohongiellaceae bacterium]
MIVATWQKCANSLKAELPPQQFNTWIRPIRVLGGGNTLHLLTPNRFVMDWVKEHFLPRIEELLIAQCSGSPLQVVLEVANSDKLAGAVSLDQAFVTEVPAPVINPKVVHQRLLQGEIFPAAVSPVFGNTARKLSFKGELNKNYTFANFIQGKSNQLARAAAAQVASNPGGSYNPLFIYGGVGLGKTHLMHAIGNHLRENNPSANVVYLHSQTFVGSMVSALQLNAINEFKRYYHSVDALLIDDIQFFANKERSQEEFFHTFNAIFEGGRQIIMTCDKYHSEINGLEERLKSRFGWGLSVAVEPPELETRAAILINKANHENVYLADEEAMFMAQKLRSNVRELEGALKKVIAHARFLGTVITVALIKDALKDLLAIQNKLVSVDNIQRTVAEYFKIKMADMISKRRNRSVARPRQIAMCLSKELTNHSLPEIGTLYGGRDHTTVLHACRTIKGLRQTSTDIDEDYQNLLRSLSS